MTGSIIFIPITITVGSIVTVIIDRIFGADLTERQIEEMTK